MLGERADLFEFAEDADTIELTEEMMIYGFLMISINFNGFFMFFHGFQWFFDVRWDFHDSHWILMVSSLTSSDFHGFTGFCDEVRWIFAPLKAFEWVPRGRADDEPHGWAAGQHPDGGRGPHGGWKWSKAGERHLF